MRIYFMIFAVLLTSCQKKWEELMEVGDKPTFSETKVPIVNEQIISSNIEPFSEKYNQISNRKDLENQTKYLSQKRNFQNDDEYQEYMEYKEFCKKKRFKNSRKKVKHEIDCQIHEGKECTCQKSEYDENRDYDEDDHGNFDDFEEYKNYKKFKNNIKNRKKPSNMNNSLWTQGMKSFFKDQRASKPGDILTVIIDVKDQQAKLQAKSTISAESDNLETIKTLLRGMAPSSGIVNLTLGGKKELNKDGSLIQDAPEKYEGAIPNASTVKTGTNSVERGSDTVKFNIAAIIKHQFNNGNFYIEGKQEIRVDGELREITLSGIIRSEDITSDNTIAYDKIAEARISYGGKGPMSRRQQPKYGAEIMEILSPF